jgi:hypothetical protein
VEIPRLVLLSFLILSQTLLAQGSICPNKTVSTPEAKPKYPMSSVTKPAGAVTPEERYSAQLFSHLAGAPVPMTDPRFRRVVGLIGKGNFMEAAKVVMNEQNFLKVRIRNFSLPFINKDKRPKDTLTDLQALIIGVTRDELDARTILTGDIAYVGYPNLGLPASSRKDNDHYMEFENRDLDFEKDLVRVDKQWPDLKERSGAFTTRAWAAAYYDAGTNRLAMKYAIDAFMCQEQHSYKIRGLPDYHVRRDVDRAQGGDPWQYHNDCRGCHAAMDGLDGAFAHLDFLNGELTFKTDGVVDKVNKNSYYYPEGYITTDDSWVNLLENHPTVDFGWRGPKTGMGVGAFAKLIADSKGFSRCMVQKTFLEVCGRTIQEGAPQALDAIAMDFEQNGYVLKDLFSKIAIMNECIAHPNTEVP